MRLSALFLVIGLAVSAVADEPPVVPAQAKLEQLWNEGEFTEGAALNPVDQAIYFSDIPNEKVGKIYRFDPQSKTVTVFCEDSLKSNGIVFDADGTLWTACGANHGGRAICRVDSQGKITPVVGQFEGHAFNAPNDLDLGPQPGWLYFSDPFYVGPEKLELDHMSVYLVKLSGKTPEVVRVTTEITKPNGVCISPDRKMLYVAETNNGTPKLGNSKFADWRMTLNAFPIQANGTLGERRILVDFGTEAGIDGMCVDGQGRIFAAVRNSKRFGIAVFDPASGKELGFVPTPDLPTNCCFGGRAASDWLYVTAGQGLYRVQLNTK